MTSINLNPTILLILAELSHQPATAKELSDRLGIPLGNVIAILIARKQFFRNADGTWELIQ